jgi:3-methyladenine DNA glycosylase/8-oxoguanine DNA glycosylase
LRDTALAPLIAAAGYASPDGWDGFELAVRAILGQQVTVSAAIGLAAKLLARHGEAAQPSTTGNARLTHAFLRPECLANEEVRPACPARERAITAIAATVTADPKRLRALPGVGEWMAGYTALRGMREPDAFPAATSALRARWPMRRHTSECGRAVGACRSVAPLARLCRATPVGRFSDSDRESSLTLLVINWRANAARAHRGLR